ncbi:centrosomal protein of 112 kDa-like isoform X2 [Coccinella septempunctata]|uniref:centrosomal protein of 112 kDa-like isoform X2 n=1 Tax=Coccinella septempunctata TaxID=41139 RepID=UPI001D07B69B|nr:centrosomal protein of 112 kDa-like isoform X2 [Coccinella septempunctata]
MLAMTQMIESHDFLLISLSQDVKCLDQILEHILPSAENLGLKSWLYPQKNIGDCKDYYASNQTKQVSYVGILEMIIEKLYIMFNFLNKQKANSERKRNIHYPPRMTLGRCVQMFWESAQSKEDDTPIPTVNTSTIFTINKGCQTEERNPHKCDSCSEMDLFIKDIIKFLSENFENSATKILLSNMNANIFSTTKFGATLKLTDSIKLDYKNLVNALNNKCQENNQLEEDLKKLKKNSYEEQQEIAQLDKIIHKLNENLTDAKKLIETQNGKIKNMKEEEKRLQKSCNSFITIRDDLTNEVKKLQKELSENRMNVEYKVKDYEEKVRNYNEQVAASQVTNNALKMDMNGLKSKYGELYCKYSKMCQINQKFEKNLENITDSIKDIDILVERTGIFVRNTTDRSTLLEEKIKLLRKKYDEEKIYTDTFYKLHKVH